MFGLSSIEISIIAVCALLFSALLVLVGRIWYRMEIAPKSGSLAHIDFEARREAVVGQARIERLKQLDDVRERCVYMAFEMGPELVRAINAGDGVRLRHYDMGSLTQVLEKLSQSPLAGAGLFAQVLKDSGLWSALAAMAAKKGIDLEAVFAPKPAPVATLANEAISSAASPATVKVAPPLHTAAGKKEADLRSP